MHFGIPLGEISYSATISGKGNISIYAVKNNDTVDLNADNLIRLGYLDIKSDEEQNYILKFTVPDNVETEYEQICEGLGEKVMGIKIMYSGGLKIKNIGLYH